MTVAPDTPRHDARRARWAVAAVFAANGFAMGAWAVHIPLLLPRHGIDKATLGLLILGLGIGAVGAMLFTGRLIGSHGTRRVTTVFGLLLAPVLPLIVYAPSLWVLAPAMAMLGAFGGSMDVAMNANAVEVERRLGRAIMSSSHGFWSLGGFVGAGVGGPVVEAAGAQTHALAAGGVILAALLLARPFLLDQPPPPPPVTDGGPAVLLPRDLALWLLGLMALSAMVPEGAIMDWGALYLRQDLGASITQSGLAFAAFAGAMAVMRFAGDSLRNRFGAVRTLRVSGLVAAGGLVAATVAPTVPLALAAFAVAGVGVANMVPVIFSAAGNHPGLPFGTAMATVTMVGYAGILVAPASIGVAAQTIGFRATFALLALLLVLVALTAGRASAAERA